MKLTGLVEPRETPQLELLRIGLGLALLASFVPLTPHLSEFYGDEGWVSREAFAALSLEAGWYSIFAWSRGPATLTLLHAIFMTTVVAFTIGWNVRWVKWPVWLLYVSYLNRNPAIVYGVDLLIANLLLLVCIAPVGRWRAQGSAIGQWPSGARATVCLSLVRWQMAIVFFYTAVQKLRGDSWWSGEAVWVVINNAEFAHAPVAGLLAENFWLVNLATHAALLVELAYPFLVWGARTRAWIVGAVIVFHVGTAVLFGLYLFAWVAIVGHLSFLPAGTIEWVRVRGWRALRRSSSVAATASASPPWPRRRRAASSRRTRSRPSPCT